MASSHLSFPTVDGISYLVHPQPLAKVNEPPASPNPIPVVVFTTSDEISSVDNANALISCFARVDDVYSPSFGQAVVLQSNELLAQFTDSDHFSAVYYTITGSSLEVLPPGPYFLFQGGIHQAYRLYEDELDSFIFGVIPEDVLSPQKYSVLSSLSSSGLWKRIAVPSRLYAKQTPEKPLSGSRIGIKDIFRLEGTQLTMMSRPWTELYGPDEESAEYIKKLIELGAVIVGKTKMTSFASPEPLLAKKIILMQLPEAKFDTVGQFGRSLDDLHYIVKHTFENIHQSFSGFPSKILYPSEFYPLANAKQQGQTEEFIRILEDFLGVKRTPFSFVEEWEKNPPKQAGGVPLLKYTEKSAFWALCHDYYHGCDDFRNEYKAKYGKDAFVSPVVRFRWDIGKKVSSKDYEKYLKELEVFRDWFGEHIMGPDSETLSNAILIMPYGEPDPEYRDDANPPTGTFPTIAQKFISPILHAPQLVLPFAQMPYHSRISGREEVRPIASTLIGAKGSDLMLIKLATAAFEKALWPTRIQTGRYMYPLADNPRNVGEVSINNSITYEDRRKAIGNIHKGLDCTDSASFMRIKLFLAE